MSDEAEVMEKKTLYDEIASLSGLKFGDEEDETHEAYKERVVRWFDDEYGDDDDAFDELDERIQEWVNVATKTVADNRGAQKPKALPHLEGLDPEKEEKAKRVRVSADKPAAKEKPAAKGKAAATPAKGKAKAEASEKPKRAAKEKAPPKEKKAGPARGEGPREGSCYYQVAELVVDDPTLTVEKIIDKIGFGKNTVGHARDGVLAALRVLRKKGKLAA